MKIEWLDRALLDFEMQIDYIAERNPNAAIEHLELIEQKVDNLKSFPEMGREGRILGTRELVITGTKFIAIYRIVVKDNMIQIIRLLHGSQMWP